MYAKRYLLSAASLLGLAGNSWAQAPEVTGPALEPVPAVESPVLLPAAEPQPTPADPQPTPAVPPTTAELVAPPPAAAGQPTVRPLNGQPRRDPIRALPPVSQPNVSLTAPAPLGPNAGINPPNGFAAGPTGPANNVQLNANDPAGLAMPPSPDAWRYRYQNGQWTYWSPSNQWLMWNGNSWLPASGLSAGSSAPSAYVPNNTYAPAAGYPAAVAPGYVQPYAGGYQSNYRGGYGPNSSGYGRYNNGYQAPARRGLIRRWRYNNGYTY